LAIKYLDAKRIRGSGASDDWVDTSSANTGVNLTTQKLEARIVDGTSLGNFSSTKDLGAGNVSETAWVLQFEFTEVTNLGDFGWFGIASADQSVGATSTSQDFIGLNFGENLDMSIQGTNGGAIDGNGSNVTTSFEQTTGTKYYIELKRTAADSAIVTVRTGSHSGSSVGTATSNQVTSAISGLRYLKVCNRTQGGESSGTITIENIYFWNGVTTAGSSASADYSSATIWADDKATLVSDGKDGWVEMDATYISINSTTEKIDWESVKGSIDNLYKDITSVSDTAWVLRGVLNFSAGINTGTNYWAMGIARNGTTGGNDDPTNVIQCKYQNESGANKWKINDGATNVYSNTGTMSIDTDYYWTLKRTDADTASFDMKTGSHTGSSVTSFPIQLTNVSSTAPTPYLFSERFPNTDTFPNVAIVI